VYAVKGCNSRRHIWRNNGWRKGNPNGNARNRTIGNVELWKAVDLRLSQNALVTIAWCKGHAGIAGNERADALADRGRLSLRGA
ncbi:RNase H family protein, partial [Rhizobium ruizarguesonis]